MNRRRKFAVAAAAAVMPLFLWASPAHAGGRTYDDHRSLWFNDGTALAECNLYSEATWDPDFGELVVNARERLDPETCTGSLKISVDYDDASGVRRTLSTEGITDELDLTAAGITANPRVTVTRDYFVCLQNDNTTCTTEVGYDAYEPTSK